MINSLKRAVYFTRAYICMYTCTNEKFLFTIEMIMNRLYFYKIHWS